jgi:hypothetical protein
MAKRGLKLSVPIPKFMSDRRSWRRALHAAIVQVQDRGNGKHTKARSESATRELANTRAAITTVQNRER